MATATKRVGKRFNTGMRRGWANRMRKAGMGKKRIQKVRRIARRRGFAGVKRRTMFATPKRRRRY